LYAIIVYYFCLNKNIVYTNEFPKSDEKRQFKKLKELKTYIFLLHSGFMKIHSFDIFCAIWHVLTHICITKLINDYFTIKISNYRRMFASGRSSMIMSFAGT
jgi:hypothetical protein